MYRQLLRLVQKRLSVSKAFCNRCEITRLQCERSLVSLTKNHKTELLKTGPPNTTIWRNYAKSRDIRKDKKKKVKIDEIELQEYLDVEKLFSEIQKPVETFKNELANQATLRTSSGAVENLKVNFDGDTYTLQDLASIGKKNPRLYVLDFSAFPEAIPAVLTTFQNSELNLNPQQTGTTIYVPIPRVTREHREVLAKKCKLYFTKCKERIRDIQMRYTKKLGGIEKLSIEKKFRLTDMLTALGNKHIAAAEEILKAKTEELLKEEDVV